MSGKKEPYPVVDLSKSIQERFFNKNGPSTREERERLIYKSYDEIREFADIVYRIQSTIYHYIEKNPIPRKMADYDHVNLTSIIPLIKKDYDLLPKRYQIILDNSIKNFTSQRLLSFTVFKDPILKNKLLTDMGIVRPKKIILTQFGICIKCSGEEIQRLVPHASKNIRGCVSHRYIEVNKKIHGIEVILINDSLTPDQEKSTIKHENEHVLQRMQYVFRTNDNLSRILASKSSISSDDIRIPTNSDLKRSNKYWIDVIRRSPDKINNQEFLREIRSIFFVSVRREIFSHLSKIEFLGGDVKEINRLKNKLYGIFQNKGTYDYPFRFKEDLIQEGYSVDENLWNLVMDVEYKKIYTSAIKAYFSLVAFGPIDTGGRLGIEYEKASSFLGMYSLEDWPVMVRRYNTREYNGVRIEAPVKAYEFIKLALNLFFSHSYYRNLTRFLKTIEYSNGKIILNNTHSIDNFNTNASPRVLANVLARLAYTDFCKEQKIEYNYDSFRKTLAPGMGITETTKQSEQNPTRDVISSN